MTQHSKVILDLAVTLDGFIEGINGEIDWCIMDPEMDFDAFLNQIDAIIYGRKSYDLWGEYSQVLGNNEHGDDSMWEKIHSKAKYVFTRQSINDTNHAHFINTTDLMSTVNKIKSQCEQDIWLYGGADIITSFIEHNLIDEYRLSVHPVVLGKGKPLFENVQDRLNLTLKQTNIYKSGVVQLIYGKARF
ncbi:dihydrofolate reductase family protein [Staphylococcus caeli]|uniref:Dihydrofolate reductase n=1 Tax=Staphylococcus caeli TaxID=2201815 RepID=A0A1D4R6D0_9STAP|nr:dihydrofolate reductase family protein [Staphylococcus caeli]SCT06122.1 dihydrofolate reductase [Staphylococcus caeli]SCT43144.1 dihydrofolate reductase [Staphylococcus caeli]